MIRAQDRQPPENHVSEAVPGARRFLVLVRTAELIANLNAADEAVIDIAGARDLLSKAGFDFKGEVYEVGEAALGGLNPMEVSAIVPLQPPPPGNNAG